jgi:hypothetical protein
MSQSTPMLFEVATQPTKIEAFKAKHQIETHCCKGADTDWLAIHMPSARKCGYGVTETSSLFDCFSKVGRLLDESGVAGYGDTEADAIVETCKACGITVLPSDL